jgi:hypothetical protein
MASTKFYVKGDFSGALSINQIKRVLRAHGGTFAQTASPSLLLKISADTILTSGFARFSVIRLAEIVPSVSASTFCLIGMAYYPPKPRAFGAAQKRTYVFDPANSWLQACFAQQKLLPVPADLILQPSQLTRVHGATIEQVMQAGRVSRFPAISLAAPSVASLAVLSAASSVAPSVAAFSTTPSAVCSAAVLSAASSATSSAASSATSSAASSATSSAASSATPSAASSATPSAASSVAALSTTLSAAFSATAAAATLSAAPAAALSVASTTALPAASVAAFPAAPAAAFPATPAASLPAAPAAAFPATPAASLPAALAAASSTTSCQRSRSSASMLGKRRDNADMEVPRSAKHSRRTDTTSATHAPAIKELPSRKMAAVPVSVSDAVEPNTTAAASLQSVTGNVVLNHEPAAFLQSAAVSLQSAAAAAASSGYITAAFLQSAAVAIQSVAAAAVSGRISTAFPQSVIASLQSSTVSLQSAAASLQSTAVDEAMFHSAQATFQQSSAAAAAAPASAAAAAPATAAAPASAAAAAPATAAAFASAAAADLAAASAASMPVSNLRSSLGWMIIPPSRATMRMSSSWQQLTSQTLPALHKKLPKDGAIGLRGGGVQTHFSALFSAAEQHPAMQHLLTRQFQRDEEVIRLLLRNEIGKTAESQLKLACSAHLAFEPGCIDQDLHMDIQPRELAQRCYVAIAYITRCASTYLPIDSDATERLWSNVSATQLRNEVKLEDRFRSQTVLPGSVLLMRGDTAHFGPANLSKDTRYCAYFLFSPQSGCSQAADQRYPHGV